MITNLKNKFGNAYVLYRNNTAFFVLVSILVVASISIFTTSAFGNPNDLPDQSKADVIAVMGTGHIQGELVIVEILVEIQPGENANQVASEVLKANNLKPFSSADLGTDGFTVTGFYWPDDRGLTQHFNTANEEAKTETILAETHSDWNNVGTSDFTFSPGGSSLKCPSMVKECQGPQVFDFENTVGWLSIKSRGTLAIAYFAVHSTEGPETDIALNTRYSWKNDCDGTNNSIIDVETVLRHENGHAAGIGHSEIDTALMAPYYSGPSCGLESDDKEALTYLYDPYPTGTVSGIVTNSDNGAPIVGATVELEGTTPTLADTTDGNGVYTISAVPDPVTYTVTTSADGFESFTIDRLTINGDETGVDFALTSSDGDDGGGGGPKKCHPRFGC